MSLQISKRAGGKAWERTSTKLLCHYTVMYTHLYPWEGIGCAMIRLMHFQTFPSLIIQGVQSQNLGDQAWEHGWVDPRNRYSTLNYIHHIHACTRMCTCMCLVYNRLIHVHVQWCTPHPHFLPPPLSLTPTHHTYTQTGGGKLQLWCCGSLCSSYSIVGLHTACTRTPSSFAHEVYTMYRYRGTYTHT